MTTARTLFRLLPALLLTLLFAAAPAAALPSAAQRDAAIVSSDGPAYATKNADHASKKPRPSATLSQFFEIDDDAEQDFKPQPLVAYGIFNATIGARILVPSQHPVLRTHRVCAAFPTGPPHA